MTSAKQLPPPYLWKLVCWIVDSWKIVSTTDERQSTPTPKTCTPRATIQNEGNIDFFLCHSLKNIFYEFSNRVNPDYFRFLQEIHVLTRSQNLLCRSRYVSWDNVATLLCLPAYIHYQNNRLPFKHYEANVIYAKHAMEWRRKEEAFMGHCCRPKEGEWTVPKHLYIECINQTRCLAETYHFSVL